MHRGLHRTKPVNSHVRGHFHWGAVQGDLEIDDPCAFVAAKRLRLQSSGSDVGDGVPRGAPGRRRAPLCRWGGCGRAHAAGEHKQHDEHGRPRGVSAPLTARHGSRIERQNVTAATASGSPPARWYIAIRPSNGPGLPKMARPRSSGDRAPPSGGGSASSNLAGGAIRIWRLTCGFTFRLVGGQVDHVGVGQHVRNSVGDSRTIPVTKVVDPTHCRSRASPAV
jgi:hypothetical protein